MRVSAAPRPAQGNVSTPPRPDPFNALCNVNDSYRSNDGCNSAAYKRSFYETY